MKQSEFEKMKNQMQEDQFDLTFNLSQIKMMIIEHRNPTDFGLIDISVVPFNTYRTYLLDISKEQKCPKSMTKLMLAHKPKNRESVSQYKILSFEDFKSEVGSLNTKHENSEFFDSFNARKSAKTKDLQTYAYYASRVIQKGLCPQTQNAKSM